MCAETVDLPEDASEEDSHWRQMQALKADIRQRQIQALEAFWENKEAIIAAQEKEEAERRSNDRRRLKAEWSGEERRQGERRVIGKFTEMVNKAQW